MLYKTHEDIITDAEQCHAKNITPVIYTSRTELQFVSNPAWHLVNRHLHS